MQPNIQSPESRLGSVEEMIKMGRMPLPDIADMMLKEGQRHVADVKGSLNNIRGDLKVRTRMRSPTILEPRKNWTPRIRTCERRSVK